MNKNWLEEKFKTKKAIIGLVHLQPLPGDPEYDREGGMEKIIELAKKDIIALQDGGVDGLLITNEFSLPYQTKVDTSVIASMAYIIGALRDVIKVPFGNDVICDELASISISAATGASFTRGVFHGSWATSTGIVDSDGGAEAIRLRHNLGIDDFKLVSYLMPESAGDLANRNTFDILKPIYFLTRPDAIAVAGIVAGQKPDVNSLRECRERYQDAVIFAATGVNINNVDDYLDYVDGIFVGTSFKKDGVFRNGIDYDRVKQFMDKVKEVRKKYE